MVVGGTKASIVSESLEAGETISAVVRRNGVAASLLYCCHRLMSEGGQLRRGGGQDIRGSAARRASGRAGATSLEGEILKDALAKSQASHRQEKNRACSARLS